MNKVKSFKYLGSTLSADGELDEEVEKRIQAVWWNWRKLSAVLCDRRLSTRRKGKAYKAEMSPAMTHGSETWGVKTTQEDRLNVVEMDMLRWACGHTLKDRVENRAIRERAKVAEMHRKIQERSIRWYGHILPRDEDHAARKALDVEVEGRRRQGRPRIKWMECVKKDLEKKQLRAQDTADRIWWKFLTINGNPA